MASKPTTIDTPWALRHWLILAPLSSEKPDLCKRCALVSKVSEFVAGSENDGGAVAAEAQHPHLDGRLRQAAHWRGARYIGGRAPATLRASQAVAEELSSSTLPHLLGPIMAQLVRKPDQLWDDGRHPLIDNLTVVDFSCVACA